MEVIKQTKKKQKKDLQKQISETEVSLNSLTLKYQYADCTDL